MARRRRSRRSATRASPCCATRRAAAWRMRATAGIERAAHPWIAFLDDDDRWSPDKLRVQLDRARAEDADFVYTAGLAVAAADGRVLWRSPAFTPEELRQRHSQPQPRLRGLVQRGRAHRAPAASRRLRRVAPPHRGLGSVDPPDRGGARRPRAPSRWWRTSCTRRTCTGRRSTPRRERAACCAPSTRTAACRAGSIPSSSAAGSPRDRRTRGDRGAPRSPTPSRLCATAADPMRGARWARALRALGLRRAPEAGEPDGPAPDWLAIRAIARRPWPARTRWDPRAAAPCGRATADRLAP